MAHSGHFGASSYLPATVLAALQRPLTHITARVRSLRTLQGRYNDRVRAVRAQHASAVAAAARRQGEDSDSSGGGGNSSGASSGRRRGRSGRRNKPGSSSGRNRGRQRRSGSASSASGGGGGGGSDSAPPAQPQLPTLPKDLVEGVHSALLGDAQLYALHGAGRVLSCLARSGALSGLISPQPPRAAANSQASSAASTPTSASKGGRSLASDKHAECIASAVRALGEGGGASTQPLPHLVQPLLDYVLLLLRTTAWATTLPVHSPDTSSAAAAASAQAAGGGTVADCIACVAPILAQPLSVVRPFVRSAARLCRGPWALTRMCHAGLEAALAAAVLATRRVTGEWAAESGLPRDAFLFDPGTGVAVLWRGHRLQCACH